MLIRSNKMKTSLLAIILLLPLSLYGQSKGYIVLGDTAKAVGKVSFNPREPHKVAFLRYATRTEEYVSSEVTEFSLQDSAKRSTRFVVREVELGEAGRKPVFVQELNRGETRLFYLRSGPQWKREYFLERQAGQPLEVLSKDGFRETLLSLLPADGCERVRRQIKKVGLRPNSLRQFMEAGSNRSSCERLRFPRYGISLGGGSLQTRLQSPLIVRNGNYSLQGSGFYGGFYYQQPLWMLPKTELMVEASLSWQRAEGTANGGNTTRNTTLKMMALELRAMPAYFLSPHKKASLYIGAGPHIAIMADQESYGDDLTFNIMTNQPERSTWTNVEQLPGLGIGAGAVLGWSWQAGATQLMALELGASRLYSEGANYSQLRAGLKIGF
jgi:hypothetical protein